MYGIALSAFFAIEIQNFKEQERKLCMYCKGTGYLTCAECSTSASPGRLVDPSSGSKCYCGGEGDVHELSVHGTGDGDGARPADRSVRLMI